MKDLAYIEVRINDHDKFEAKLWSKKKADLAEGWSLELHEMADDDAVMLVVRRPE